MINCPKCSDEALVETPALGNIPLDVCPGCSGIWFDKGELEALLKQSQGWHSADFTLINAKAEGLVCPRCKSKMSRGGLVNPLLLVDQCPSCGRALGLGSSRIVLAVTLLLIFVGFTFTQYVVSAHRSTEAALAKRWFSRGERRRKWTMPRRH